LQTVRKPISKGGRQLTFTVPSTIDGLEGELDIVKWHLVIVPRVAMSQDEERPEGQEGKYLHDWGE
jgi:hypothetical protein